jgi:hypothetical protein
VTREECVNVWERAVRAVSMNRWEEVPVPLTSWDHLHTEFDKKELKSIYFHVFIIIYLLYLKFFIFNQKLRTYLLSFLGPYDPSIRCGTTTVERQHIKIRQQNFRFFSHRISNWSNKRSYFNPSKLARPIDCKFDTNRWM